MKNVKNELFEEIVAIITRFETNPTNLHLAIEACAQCLVVMVFSIVPKEKAPEIVSHYINDAIQRVEKMKLD